METLRATLTDTLSNYPDATVAVAIRDLASGDALAIRGDRSFHAASTMKVPVMMEVFRQAEAGAFQLDDSLTIRNTFASIVDGSTYQIEDDSDEAIYERIGEPMAIRDLTERMITVSSNLATNMIIELATADSVQQTIERLGAERMQVLRGVEDIKAYRQGLNNTATANDLALIFEAIAEERIVSPSASEVMIDILQQQEFNDMIPAGLPSGTEVAHKTGWITEIHHDAAIVYPPDRPPYVLVVLTEGIADRDESARLVATIARVVAETLQGDAPARAGDSDGPPASDPSALAELHAQHRVDGLDEREFTAQQLWDVLGPIVDRSDVLEREEVGRSARGRPIHLVRYGRGSTRVLLWSQMHGDESTATMALADLFHFFADDPDHPLARRIADEVTVLAIPMLNPDGAEHFQRRNAQGIDINRDAERLSTPEARTLKRMQERFTPDFGFNLHDQNVRTRVQDSNRMAAVGLLAPPFDEEETDNAVRVRAKRIAAVIRHAVEPMVGGHITRYDAPYMSRAFGDRMQQWGVSTVLLESGGWTDDPEKQYLRQVNFAGLLGAFEAMATGRYAEVDLAGYTSLPENGRGVYDLLVHGGTVVVPDLPHYCADLAINYDKPLERRGGRVEDVGTLAGYAEARDTLDANGLYLHPQGALREASREGMALSDEAPAHFILREGPAPSSPAVWTLDADGPPRRATENPVSP